MKKPTLALIGCLVALSGLARAQTIAHIEIAYTTTTGVRNSVGGSSNARSLLLLKYDLLRDAEARSVGNIRWRVSGQFDATYDEQDQTAITQLNRLLDGSEFNGFRRHRDQQNGDLGQVYCDWTNLGVLGIAFQPGWASICRRAVLTANTGNSGATNASTHECGHSMNADHANGHCMSRLNARTIMEDNSGCPTNERIFYFSSPNTTVDGRVIGNSSNQNRERIRARAPTTAAQQ